MADYASKRQLKVACNEPDAQSYRYDEAGCLDEIGPDNRFYTAFVRVKPHASHRQGYVYPEWNAQRTEGQKLQGEANQEQTNGCT